MYIYVMKKRSLRIKIPKNTGDFHLAGENWKKMVNGSTSKDRRLRLVMSIGISFRKGFLSPMTRKSLEAKHLWGINGETSVFGHPKKNSELQAFIGRIPRVGLLNRKNN